MNRDDLPRLTDDERAELDSGYVAMEGVPVGEELAYTRGPWRMLPPKRLGSGFRIHADNPARGPGHRLTFVNVAYAFRSEADARLIAAAPLLLAALKRARDNGLADNPDVILVRAAMDAAIKAAEGQS